MAYWGALIVSPPVWGAIADGIHNQKLAHTMCLVSAAFLFFSIQYVTSFPLMCVMVFIANFQTQPSFSLLDHASMAWLERVAGDYGKQRLYGAAGYGAGGYFASVVASISLFLLLTYVPNFQHEAEKHEKGELLKSLKAILRQHDVLALFMITISELPFFFHANKIIERFGTAKCILVSLVAYGIRMITYAFIQNPWLVLPIEVLHGLTYGLLLAAFTNYIYEAAPKGTEGTMIGVLFGVQRGIGGGLSTLGGGWVYEVLGGRTMWGIAGFIVFPLSLVASAGFAYLARSYTTQSPAVSKGSVTSDESSLLATSDDYGATVDVSAQC
ncbi:Major Facilitator Superfamily (MFS) [Phytophthora infestans T30-4]|uniref:Major Facilitator Superfamily (MFS) n=1 Tax=Phytophthora infestans (strain T30-4) TaxID=403677 RepID=D0P1P7_PHYIT|nr:Major Facilitator Superfamily (MFS) [Phytophthora infestans T30-4]EEY54681.1 Major Facilitator Superfamily (MFS) [Phytophthora infestans T30-4]|eukprot:XP_002895775.1 Major Facilitator Superfamily (MFS) [Phytophthora infestans T30-4]